MLNLKVFPALLVFATVLFATSVQAQWTHRYPPTEPFGHQLYLEQEDLPIISSGPTYPAASPDGRSVAFAHQGWIWILDLETRAATRLTSGAHLDARPRWSPDGGMIAFVRDEGTDTDIVILNLSDGSEKLIDSPALDLDPEFTRDGRSLVYTSAREGRLDLWLRDLQTGADSSLAPPRTTDPQAPRGHLLRRSARALADGRMVVVRFPYPEREIRLLTPSDTTAEGLVGELLVAQGWMVHMDPDVHPSEPAIVYGFGNGNDNRLAVMDVDRPTVPRWLTPAGEKSLFPTWSSDGHIYYVKADDGQQFELMRIRDAGGRPERVSIERWDYGTAVGRASLTFRGGEGRVASARIAIAGADGHPAVNPHGPTFVDNQNGPVYFYTDGHLSLDLPVGTYTVTATRGPFSLPESETFTIGDDQITRVELTIDEIWNARDAGYASADHHIHLNSSGVHDLELDDLLPLMQGEALDFAAPMAWNQFNRFIDADRIGDVARAPDGTTAKLTQEVRSDFHGHIGMIGASRAYNPWFFGPGTPVYGDRNIYNGQVPPFANAQGALPTYVHPTGSDSDPWDLENPAGFPYELVVDGVLTDGLGLEVVCQWTSPYGTSAMWYRFLNIGKTMPATAGTDMMANFYRLPAVGTARALVPVAPSRDGFDAVIDQVRAGKGFVTTGPALLFEVSGSEPGGVVESGPQSWSLELISVRPVDRIEIVVNGEIVDSLAGFEGGGSRRYEGEIELPTGGWIAARAVGGDTDWPTMAFAHFAHTQPVWIGSVASTEPASRRRAATDLLGALDLSERQFEGAYQGDLPPGLAVRISEARAKLSAIQAE